jgi:hypothetical protein
VRIDALAVRLRQRTPLEAADLGVRLCQHFARSVFSCYAIALVPVVTVAAATFEFAPWLTGLTVWIAKPWLDRTILFALSRAAFGQPTTPGDLWRAQRDVWWRQLLFTLTIRRLSPWRSLTAPVYQLEGLSIRQAARRVRHIRRRTMTAGVMVIHAFAMAEFALMASLVSLVFWMAPAGLVPGTSVLLEGSIEQTPLLMVTVMYVVAALVVEPFYAAAGFAMYLSRRADLEAWDIEQDLRRAFAA